MNLSIKPIYIIIGAAIMLAACSQVDEPYGIDGESNLIRFRTSLPKLSTRAEVTTKKNLPGFYVTAFDFDDQTLMNGNVMQPLFGNRKIDIVGDEGAYTSPECRWPDQSKETHRVSFFSFYPGLPEIDGTQLINTSSASAVDYKLAGFKVAADIADQVDFITAYTTGTMADNLFSGITLPFAHQLSRIEVKAYGAHKSCDIEIAGVRIGGIGVMNTFEFKPIDGGGEWTGNPDRGIVEYIFRKGDRIVSLGKNNPIVAKENAVSIMGAKHADDMGKEYENCAMLIPASYSQWEGADDPHNGKNQMFISVLLRITDAITSAGVNPPEKQRYPYRDLSQGTDALKIPMVYLAIDKATGEVFTRLYKKQNDYFTDPGCTSAYAVPMTQEVKEFGWAALPVEGEWLPGNIYTYTLDYTQGVGLHDPEVITTFPGAGDPIISDRVGITYTIKEWNTGGSDQFIAPPY